MLGDARRLAEQTRRVEVGALVTCNSYRNPELLADMARTIDHISGGGEKKTLRLVAKHADIWHTFAQGDELRHKLSVLDEHCQAVARERADIEVSVGVGGRGREGRQPASPRDEGEPLLALGATLFTMGTGGPEYDMSALPAWLQWRDEINSRLSVDQDGGPGRTDSSRP